MSISLFATVFAAIFVAELPDKTVLATLAMATRHRPLPVFVGAALALAIQAIIAVGAGSILAELPGRYVRIGSGLVFFACAIVMWIQKHDADEAKESADKPSFMRALWTVFALVFVAELGDLTQLGTAAFQATYHDALTVLPAAIAALWSVTAIAVFVGNRAAKLLDPKVMRKVAAVIFGGVGVALLVGALRQ